MKTLKKQVEETLNDSDGSVNDKVKRLERICLQLAKELDNLRNELIWSK